MWNLAAPGRPSPNGAPQHRYDPGRLRSLFCFLCQIKPNMDCAVAGHYPPYLAEKNVTPVVTLSI
jgi:hypothetical protein